MLLVVFFSTTDSEIFPERGHSKKNYEIKKGKSYNKEIRKKNELWAWQISYYTYSFDLHKIYLYHFYIPPLQSQLQMISYTDGNVLGILVAETKFFMFKMGAHAQVSPDLFICLCTYAISKFP